MGLSGTMLFGVMQATEPVNLKRFVVVMVVSLHHKITTFLTRKLFNQTSLDRLYRNAAYRVLFDAFRIVLVALTAATRTLAASFSVDRIIQVRGVTVVLAVAAGIGVSAFTCRPFCKFTQRLFLPTFIADAGRNVPRCFVLGARLLSMKTMLNLVGARFSTSSAKMIEAVLEALDRLKTRWRIPTIAVPTVQFTTLVWGWPSRSPSFVCISVSHNSSYCIEASSFCQVGV